MRAASLTDHSLSVVGTSSVTVEQLSDKSKVIELIPDGANIAVTEENKREYIELRFRWIVANSVLNQLASMVQGLYAVIPKELMSVFDHQELELLMCGIPEIDLVDWKSHTIYVGERDERVTSWFWGILEEFTNEQKARLLQFTTGSARVPVQGFKALTMNDGRICPFAIQCVNKEECLYPRAHTCFNRCVFVVVYCSLVSGSASWRWQGYVCVLTSLYDWYCVCVCLGLIFLGTTRRRICESHSRS